jgi:hypothetical protein
LRQRSLLAPHKCGAALITKNKSSKSLDAPEKPYYCGTKTTSSGAVSPRLCLASHRTPHSVPPKISLQKARGLRTLSALKAVSFAGHHTLLIVTQNRLTASHPVFLRPPGGPRSERMRAQSARCAQCALLSSSLTTEHHEITGHWPGCGGLMAHRALMAHTFPAPKSGYKDT